MKIITLVCDGCNSGEDDDVRVKQYRIEVGTCIDEDTHRCKPMWERVDYCDACYKVAFGRHGGDIERI